MDRNVESGDDVSVGQPAWQRDGTLRFVSDRLGWWQPYVHAGVPDGGPTVALTAVEAEFHGPDWALGQSTISGLCAHKDGLAYSRRGNIRRRGLLVRGEGPVCPGGAVLLLQGLDDLVVPPAQTERLQSALLARGRHCTVRFFEGEGHGFRRAETLEACLEEELAFYRRELDV